VSREHAGGLPEARAKFAKAAEFLADAQDALAKDRPNAACSNAVNAAINANDALCLARLQRYSTASTHAHALDLARGCGSTGRQVATQLERILKAKDKAQYETASVRPAEAANVVDRAARIIELVRAVLAGG
jgi:uncharacterized protein (UPF0332 family)